MVEVYVRSFLIGKDTDTSIRYLVAALALFVALAGIFIGTVEFNLLPMGVWPFVPVLMALGGVGVAIHGFRNNGLLISCVFFATLLLSLFAPLTVFDWVTPSEDLLWGLGVSVLFGAPAGFVGFLLGAGARRIGL